MALPTLPGRFASSEPPATTSSRLQTPSELSNLLNIPRGRTHPLEIERAKSPLRIARFKMPPKPKSTKPSPTKPKRQTPTKPTKKRVSSSGTPSISRRNASNHATDITAAGPSNYNKRVEQLEKQFELASEVARAAKELQQTCEEAREKAYEALKEAKTVTV